MNIRSGPELSSPKKKPKLHPYTDSLKTHIHTQKSHSETAGIALAELEIHHIGKSRNWFPIKWNVAFD